MRIIYIIVFGFFLGTTLTALFSPGLVSWYFDPPTSIGVSCKEAVVWGINAYQKMVLIGGVIGLFVGIILAAVFRRGKALPPSRPAGL
jgi:hypothetical protein